MSASSRVLLPILLCMLCSLLLFPAVSAAGNEASSENLAPRDVHVLVIIPDQYGANMFLYLNDFELLGWRVTTAGLTESIAPCALYAKGLGCPSIVPDLVIEEAIDVSAYDALVLMPASGNTPRPYRDLLSSSLVLDAIAEAYNTGLTVTAQCSGPRVLGEAGILAGKSVVARDRFATYLESLGAEYLGAGHPPVVDGNVITAVKGLYYSREYTDAISALVQAAAFPREANRNLAVSTPTLEVSAARETDDGLLAWTLGGPFADGARAASACDDGASYIAGYTYSFGSGSSDVLLIKLEADGAVAWARTLGGVAQDEANGILTLPDGGCVVAGMTRSVGGGGSDLLVARFDADGTLMWQRTLGGSGDEVAASLCGAHGSGVVVAGHVQARNSTVSNLWLVKISATGDVVWEHTYGTDDSERGHDVIATRDGGYIVAGFAGNGPPDKQMYVVKTNSAGILQWEQRLGNDVFDAANAVVEAPAGGYVLVGSNDELKQELMELTVVGIDGAGVVQWRKEHGRRNTYDFAFDIATWTHNGYVIAGVTNGTMTGENQAWLQVADYQGAIEASYAYGDEGSEWLRALCVFSDGRILSVGHTDSSGAGSFDVLVLQRPGS